MGKRWRWRWLLLVLVLGEWWRADQVWNNKLRWLTGREWSLPQLKTSVWHLLQANSGETRNRRDLISSFWLNRKHFHKICILATRQRDKKKICEQATSAEPFAHHRNPYKVCLYSLCRSQAHHFFFSTTCCSQSWLIAGTPSAQSESICQAIVFTTASQMGEWLRRNSDSLEGSKPLLLSFLPATLPASYPSSPKRRLCRKQASQGHLANCLRPCACRPWWAGSSSSQQPVCLFPLAHCPPCLKIEG